MKRILILIFAPILLVIGGFAAVLVLDNAPLTPGAPVCGISLDTELAVAMGPDAIENRWQVYTYASTTEAPQILTTEKRFTDSPLASRAQGCELAIQSLPDESEVNADWRIGFSSPNIENLRGKIIKSKLFLRADEETKLSSGSVYIYDGTSVVSVGVTNIGQSWNEYEISHQVPENADTFEVWFRLLFKNQEVVPAQSKIQLIARMEETNVIAAPRSPLVQDSQFTPATCPLIVDGQNLNLQNTDDWIVYRFEATTTPDVSISPQTSKRTGSPEAWCDLAITNAPDIPGKAIDWRMGHEFDVTEFRGKKVSFSARMKASEATKLNSARLYTYDGHLVHEVLVPELSTEWTEFTMTTDVPPDAKVFQAWFRLIFDNGTIDPSNVIVSFAPEITLVRQ